VAGCAGWPAVELEQTGAQQRAGRAQRGALKQAAALFRTTDAYQYDPAARSEDSWRSRTSSPPPISLFRFAQAGDGSAYADLPHQGGIAESHPNRGSRSTQVSFARAAPRVTGDRRAKFAGHDQGGRQLPAFQNAADQRRHRLDCLHAPQCEAACATFWPLGAVSPRASRPGPARAA